MLLFEQRGSSLFQGVMTCDCGLVKECDLGFAMIHKHICKGDLK